MPKEYRGGGKLGKWVLLGHVFPTSLRSDVMLLLHTTVINYLVSIEMTVLLECLIAKCNAAPRLQQVTFQIFTLYSTEGLQQHVLQP